MKRITLGLCLSIVFWIAISDVGLQAASKTTTAPRGQKGKSHIKEETIPSEKRSEEAPKQQEREEILGSDRPSQPSDKKVFQRQSVPSEPISMWVWALGASVAVLVVAGAGLLGWCGVRNFRQGLSKEIDSKIDPMANDLKNIFTSLRGLEGALADVDKIPRQLGDLSKQLSDRVGIIRDDLHSMTKEISSAVGALPSVLRADISEAIQSQLRAEAEKSVTAKIAAAVSRVQRELEMLHQDYPVIDIAHAVKEAFFPLPPSNEAKSLSEASLSPYLQLEEQWQMLHRKVTRLGQEKDTDLGDQEEEVRKLLAGFREKATLLSRDHRPVWFVPFLEKAASDAASREKIEQLKNTLGIEDFSVQAGAEARNLDELEVAGTKGTGRRSFVHEVVERGYRERVTGTVIRKPRVIIRFEG